MLEWSEAGVSQGSDSALAGEETIQSQVDNLSKGAVSRTMKDNWLEGGIQGR